MLSKQDKNLAEEDPAELGTPNSQQWLHPMWRDLRVPLIPFRNVP